MYCTKYFCKLFSIIHFLKVLDAYFNCFKKCKVLNVKRGAYISDPWSFEITSSKLKSTNTSSYFHIIFIEYIFFANLEVTVSLSILWFCRLLVSLLLNYSFQTCSGIRRGFGGSSGSVMIPHCFFIAGMCPVLCSGHGDYEDGQCRCFPGWKGLECQLRHDQCEVADCNGHGQCVNGKCVCARGYTGNACQQSK